MAGTAWPVRMKRSRWMRSMAGPRPGVEGEAEVGLCQSVDRVMASGRKP